MPASSCAALTTTPSLSAVIFVFFWSNIRSPPVCVQVMVTATPKADSSWLWALLQLETGTAACQYAEPFLLQCPCIAFPETHFKGLKFS